MKLFRRRAPGFKRPTIDELARKLPKGEGNVTWGVNRYLFKSILPPETQEELRRLGLHRNDPTRSMRDAESGKPIFMEDIQRAKRELGKAKGSMLAELESPSGRNHPEVVRIRHYVATFMSTKDYALDSMARRLERCNLQ